MDINWSNLDDNLKTIILKVNSILDKVNATDEEVEILEALIVSSIKETDQDRLEFLLMTLRDETAKLLLSKGILTKEELENPRPGCHADINWGEH